MFKTTADFSSGLLVQLPTSCSFPGWLQFDQRGQTMDFNEFNKKVIAEFRANSGVVGGMFEGAPMLILTTTGAKSGQPREIPLVYTKDGDLPVIIASKGGAPTNPDWYFNLKANPLTTIELGADTYRANVVEVTDERRDRLYAQMVNERPDFGTYQQNTTRLIPVFVIERIR